MLRIAAASTLVVTFMSQVALAQSGSGSNSGSNFANCLCYNQQTQSFCHGHEWYNSEACQDWLAADFNWILVIFAFVCLMFAFPFLFCCSRFCCQCCGGNKPTRGCCCSDQSTQAIFPGYTNRSIALTRGAYLIGFCLAIATTFVSWNHNNNLHTATNEAVSTLQQGVQQLQQYGQAVNTVATYAATPNNYLAQAPVVPVNMDTIHTVSNTVSTIHDAENNDGYGRAHLTTVLSFWALVVPVVAFIPMACSWKSSMNVFLVIQCLIATMLLIAVMPLGALAEVVEESCNNWNTVTQPFITGAMQEAGVGSTMQQADNLYNYIFNNVLNAPLPQSGSSSDGSAGTGSASSSMPTTFCADVQAVCLAIGGCATTPCTASNAQSVAYGCNGGYSQQFTTGWSFNQQMTSFMNSVCSGKQQTIVTAAATNAKAQAIVNFANAVSGFEHVTGSQSPYSGWVMNMLNNVEWPLCARVRGHAKNVAISIGVQYLVALVMMVAIFLGIKRFAKWNSYNPYAEYIGLGTEAAPVITAIVVEINHDAPWSPSPNGYAESPVGGYTEAC